MELAQLGQKTDKHKGDPLRGPLSHINRQVAGWGTIRLFIIKRDAPLPVHVWRSKYLISKSWTKIAWLGALAWKLDAGGPGESLKRRELWLAALSLALF